MDCPTKVLRILSTLAALSSGAAASAGEIGATSSETVTISLTVAPHLAVHEAAAANGQALSRRSRTYGFCVSGNTSTMLYGVALAASAEGRSATDEPSPLLEWAGAPNASNGSPIRPGVPVTGFVGAGGVCGGGTNATLIVRPSPGHPAAQSFGQTTLLIVPE